MSLVTTAIAAWIVCAVAGVIAAARPARIGPILAGIAGLGPDRPASPGRGG